MASDQNLLLIPGLVCDVAVWRHQVAHLADIAEINVPPVTQGETIVEMARIVQAADIQGQLENHPAAHGLQLISHGFPLVANDDHQTVEQTSFVYDSLYASIKESQTHQ